MKRLLIFVFVLAPFILCVAQEQQKTAAQKQEYPARMTPQMTEFFDPEVKIIQPAAVAGNAAF